MRINASAPINHAPTCAVRCNGAQLDGQRVLGDLVVLHAVVVSTAAVKELPTTHDGAVGEVEPQVGGEVTLLTLPASRGAPHTVVQLGQALRMSGEGKWEIKCKYMCNGKTCKI